MTFLWREALWLLIVLPAAAAAYVLLVRRRRAGLRYASVGLVKAAAPHLQRWRRHVPPALFGIALAAMLLAIARPTTVASISSEQRTIMLAIDVSYSMAAEDVAPSRLAAAQAAAKSFVRSQPRDVRVGVIAFAGYADLVQRPTTDRNAVYKALDTLQLQYHTAIGSGLVAALLAIFPDMDVGNYDIFGLGRSPVKPQRVERHTGIASPRVAHPTVPPGSYSPAAIVLLTDGRSSFGIPHERAAQFAAERGVRVFTVGFGRPEEIEVNIEGETITVDFDEQALKEIAAATRGAYFQAGNAEELNRVYRTLRGEVVLERRQRELTPLLAALAAVLLISSGGLSLAWCGRFA